MNPVSSLPRMFVSQSEIAQRAGVAKSTVSKALRDDPKVHPHTRQRIHELAAQMGYRPDPMLAKIASMRWKGGADRTGVTIAFLDTKASGEYEYQAIAQRASELGYALQRFDCADFRDHPDKLQRILNARNVQGLILHRAISRKNAIELDWSRHSVVKCGAGSTLRPFDTVKPDVFAATALAWRKLYEHGCRRIGAIMLYHAPILPDDSLRDGAILHMQTRFSPPSERIPTYAYTPHHTGDSTTNTELLEWLTEHKPDGILQFNVGSYDSLTPDDPRLQHFRAINLNLPIALLHPPSHARINGPSGGHAPPSHYLGWIDPMTRQCGRFAMDHLHAQLISNHRGISAHPRTLQVEPQWIPA